MYRSLYAIYTDDTSRGVQRSKMRTTVLLVVSLLGILATVQGQNETAPVSSNDAVTLGMDMLLEFENVSGGYLGCCPDIVRGPKGSVIEPFTGYRGNVAIIVDWGYHRRHWRRPCTPSDHGFIWYVNWGDGTYDIGTQENLGPFQKAHQYPKYVASYGVTVYYCSNPGSPKCNFRRCCDNIYQTIYVSYDPQHPFPPGTFKN